MRPRAARGLRAGMGCPLGPRAAAAAVSACPLRPRPDPGHGLCLCRRRHRGRHPLSYSRQLPRRAAWEPRAAAGPTHPPLHHHAGCRRCCACGLRRRHPQASDSASCTQKVPLLVPLLVPQLPLLPWPLEQLMLYCCHRCRLLATFAAAVVASPLTNTTAASKFPIVDIMSSRPVAHFDAK